MSQKKIEQIDNEKMRKIAKEISKMIPNENKDNVDTLMSYALNTGLNSIARALKNISFSEMSVNARIKLVSFLMLDINKMIAPCRKILIGNSQVFNGSALAREIKAIPKESSIRIETETKDGKVQIRTKIGVEIPQDDELEKLIKQASSSVLAEA